MEEESPSEIPIYPEKESETRLVNVYEWDGPIDVYIGGDNNEYDESIHSNPFEISEYGRRPSLAHFKVYFFKRYLQDESYREEVDSLYGKTLGGTSYPRHDHGEIIVDFVNYAHENDFSNILDYIEDEVKNIDDEWMDLEGYKLQDDVLSLVKEYRD